MFFRYRLPFSLVVYSVCFAVLFPYYRYIFDSDNMGYFMITKYLAAGEYYNSIHGYWSPLHAWLAVPFYKMGLNEFDSFRLVSGLAGAGIVWMVHRLIKKQPIPEPIAAVTLLVSVFVALTYVFYNQAADILICFCLLLYTDVITEKDLFENRQKVIACGLIGCLSYFAKTYAFLFFPVHFTLTQFILYRNATRTDRKNLLVKNLVSGYVSFLLPALPWIYALYYKYHFITYGYSGKLNFNWQMYGWGANPEKLYAISPGPLAFHWQDPLSYPWNFQEHPSWFSSTIVKKQIGVLAGNIQDALHGFVFISLTLLAVIPVLGVYAFAKRKIRLQLIFLVMILLPAGYLLVAIEARYLWTTGFLSLIGGAALLTEALRTAVSNRTIRRLCWLVYFGSFFIFTAPVLPGRMGAEKEIFAVAAELKAQGVQGKFLSNNFEDLVIPRKLAYLTNSRLYQLSREVKNYEELLQACRESGIDYLLYIHYTELDKEALRNSALYKNAVQEIKVPLTNLTVLKMH